MIATTVLLGLSFAAAQVQPVAVPPAHRILVVPFENTAREPRVGWLGEAAAVLVADELGARGLAAIRRAERVRAFEQLHLPVAASLSRATIIKVGQLLGASEVIVGAFKVNASELVIEAHSIRIDVGRLQPHVAERGPLTELFAVCERLARRLAADASAAPRRPEAPVPPPLGAFEQYIKGVLAESAATRATFLESALDDAPGFDRARLALWDVRHEQGDHAAALAAVKSVRETSPYAARARFRAGVSLLEMGQYPEAFSTFKLLLDSLPASRDETRYTAAPTLNNLGIVQLRRGSGDGGSSVYFLTKAADADPADPDYQFNLGYAYARERNFSGAIYWLREAVRRDPADAEAHYVLAVALQATGSVVEAARERELAMRLASEHEMFEAAPGSERHAVPPGLERLRLEIELPPATSTDHVISVPAQRDQQEQAVFHLDRARRLFQQDQDREALSELRRAVYLSPYLADAHLLIGRIHLRSSRPLEAIDALKISIWSQDGVPARIALAEAYLATKNTEGAREELETALKLDPASVEAKRLLDRIR